MIIAVGILAICNLAIALGVVLLVRHWIRGQVRQISELASAELVKLVNGEPCQTAAVLNAAGRVIGSEAGRSAKASLMADLAHVKRAQNATAADQQLEMIQDSNPGIGGILAGIGPGKRSRLLSNPLVQLAMSAFLGGSPGATGGAASGDNGGSSSRGSIRDRLTKGG